MNSDPGGRPVKPAAGGSGRSLNIHEELISGGKDPLVDAPISLSMKFTLKKTKSADLICISPTGGTWGLFHLERADCCRIEKRESLVKTGGRLRRFSAGISRFFHCVRRGNVATRRSGRKRKQKQNFSAASIGWESVGAMQHFTSLVCLQCRSSGTTFTDLNFPRCATLPRSFYLNILLLGCYLIKINCFYINR